MRFVWTVLFTALCISPAIQLSAQATESELIGRITDSTGAVLPSSEIEVTDTVTKTTKATVSNSEGNYRVSVGTKGIYTVSVRQAGFQPQTIANVQFRNGAATTRLDITLQLNAVASAVTVTLDDKPLMTTTSEISLIEFVPSQITALPSLGEQDIFRAFQLLPGIAGSNETSSGLSVRGGKPDQTLVEYDSFRAYGVDHLFGYFSAFNMDAVQKVELSKGGFEAKKGGTLSSFMDLTGKSGRLDRPEFTVGISLLSLHGQFQTPIIRDKASIIVSYRRSFQGPLFNKILKTSQVTTSAPRGGPAGGPGGGPGFGSFNSQPISGFYDGNAKFLWKPSTAQTVSISSYKGSDDIDNSRSFTLPTQFLDFIKSRGIDLAARGIDVNNPNVDIKDLRTSGNTGAGLEWAGKWNDRISSNASLGYSRFKDIRNRSFQAGNANNPAAEENRLEDLTLKMNLAINLGQRNTLEGGVEASTIRDAYVFRAGGAPPSGSTTSSLAGVLDQSGRSRTTAVFLQDRLIPGKRALVVPGVRVTRYDRTGRSYLDPRFAGYLFLNDNFKLKLAGGRYHQFTSRVTREDLLQGNRAFWTAADGVTVPVSSNKEIIAGGTFEYGQWLFDSEAYKKTISGLSQFAPRFSTAAASVNYRDFFYVGEGRNRGIEMLVQKRSGRNTGWLSYTLSEAKEYFPTLNTAEYYADQDQRHEFKIVDVHPIGGWKLSGTWIYATVKPYTAPNGTEPVTLPFGGTFDRVTVGDKNGSRLSPYHRMDLSLTRELVSIGDGGKGTFGISVFNVYNRKNIWYKEFNVIAGQITENNIRLMGTTLNIFFTIGSGTKSW